MATAREIITRALRRIRVVSLIEEPAAEIQSHALSVFNDLLTALEADGMTTETVTLSGVTVAGSRVITGLNAEANLYNTDQLVDGMEVFGAGVSSTIHKIVSLDEIELAGAATATGTADLTFSALPTDDSLTQAFVDVLAERLSEDFGKAVGSILARDASRGRAQIAGRFFKVPQSKLDRLLTRVSSRVYYDGSDF